MTQRSEAGQIAELEKLERRAAASRHMIDSVRDAELAHGRRAVTAADDSEAAAIRHRFRDGASPGREWSELEHTHRTVPQHRCRVRDDVGVVPCRLGSDVETLPAVGNSRRTDVSGLGIGRHLVRDYDVGRDVDASGREQLTAMVDLILFDERVSDRSALRDEKRECHGAADQHTVAPLQQRLDDAELVADFDTTQDPDEWTSRLVELCAKSA